ncbi:ADP-ribosylation factor-like protein 6-interacting protein 4 isoform X2 [Liolophura sinensis]|uniref:ADP-ribosylation factor-like protein 6-interacting protein 4 isoform X2 n=1 Tax=Liolophura sinensis TaxID=3198878 RepID=UPI0031584046
MEAKCDTRDRSPSSEGRKSRSKSKRKKYRRHSSTTTSSSSPGSCSRSRSKKSRKKTKQRKRQKSKKSRHRSSSSSSSTSSSSERERKSRKKKKRHKKKKCKDKKKSETEDSALDVSKWKAKRTVSEVKLREKSAPEIGPAPPRKSLKPMTKEEWEKEQSVVRRVFDPDTGRTRLIKGDGEIIEEIVSKERQMEINKAALGDGYSFQARVGLLKR